MLNYSKDGVTTTIILDNRRVLADGGYPVKVRVTYNRKVKYFSTGKSLTPTEWDVVWTTKNKELSSTRKDIINSFELVKEAVEDLTYAGDFSFVKLIAKLRHASSTSLNDLIEEVIADFRSKEQIGTAQMYSFLLLAINKYRGRVVLSAITPQWLEGFEAYMATYMRPTTIAIRLRTLRAVLNYGIREGVLRQSDYPFGRGKFEIQEGEGRKMALTIEQIGKIARYDDGDTLSRKYRDWWMFLYFCNGINVADFVQLKYKDMVGGEIRFVRQKTAKTTRKRKEIAVVVTEPMQEIIERWGNPVAPNNYIFPILDGKESIEERIRKTHNATRAISQRMEKIAKALGIPHISTYTARHSFATVLKRAGANIAYISESLGHTDLKTTEHYLASFEREEREKNAALLTKF